MLQHILRRLLETIPVIFVVVTATFFLVRLAPGDPFDDERQLTAEARANLEAHYGLDEPLFTQYLNYWKGLLRGDLGPSFKNPSQSVNEIIASKIPISLELGAYGLAIAFILGIIFGIIASIKANTPLDYSVMGVAMVGICLPTFVIGPLLVLTFALNLDWFPATGWDESWEYKVLPAMTLGLYYAAYVARLNRGAMLEVVNSDYIRTARAKGLAPRKIFTVHALRNAVIPVVNFLGPAAAGLISGSFIIETIFFIPGLGRHFVQAAINRDYTLVLGTAILYALLLIAFNLVVDLLQMWLNPKQRND